MLLNGYICKCVGQKGLLAMLASIQSASVTPEVNLSKHTSRTHSDFETQGRHDKKSTTKRTCVLHKFQENGYLEFNERFVQSSLSSNI